MSFSYFSIFCFPLFPVSLPFSSSLPLQEDAARLRCVHFSALAPFLLLSSEGSGKEQGRQGLPEYQKKGGGHVYVPATSFSLWVGFFFNADQNGEKGLFLFYSPLLVCLARYYFKKERRV